MAKMGEATLTKTLQPEWFADFGTRDHLLPAAGRVDSSLFLATDGTKVTLTANAIIGATAMTVTAITNPLPAGTLLNFGVGKYARTTALEPTGETSIAVEALPAQINNGDSATYAGTGKVEIPSGTFVGRTYAERAAAGLFGPADAADDEQYLIAYDISDAVKSPEATFVSPGSRVKENKLPGWATMSAGLQADIRAKYVTIRGTD